MEILTRSKISSPQGRTTEITFWVAHLGENIIKTIWPRTQASVASSRTPNRTLIFQRFESLLALLLSKNLRNLKQLSQVIISDFSLEEEDFMRRLLSCLRLHDPKTTATLLLVLCVSILHLSEACRPHLRQDI